MTNPNSSDPKQPPPAEAESPRADGAVGSPGNTPPRPSLSPPPEEGGSAPATPRAQGSPALVAVAGEGGSGVAELRGQLLQKRKASEVVAPARVVPRCVVCRRKFGSWRALFGHTRSHSGRERDCCFRSLISPAKLGAPAGGPDQVASPPLEEEGVYEAPAQGLGIDLNDDAEEESATGGNATAEEDDGSGIDLNKSLGKKDTA